MPYHINENDGDLHYEVQGENLNIKIKPEVISSINPGRDIYIIKEEDGTPPSDDNVFSGARTIKEINEAAGKFDDSNYVKKTGELAQNIEGNILVHGDVIAWVADPNMPLELPIASAEQLGCVKAGDNIAIDEDGVISATSGSGGIASLNVTGSGNAITAMSLSPDGKTITANKDLILATSTELTTHASNSIAHMTAAERVKWNTAYDLAHYHNNKALLDLINQGLSTTSDVEFNQVRATGDIIAYATGDSISPFLYWRPSVSSSGLLSWSNSYSETTPTSVNIKGADGQGVTYGWSGTSLRLGTISPTGAVSWGPYVDLKGDDSEGGAVSSVQYMANSSTPTKSYEAGVHIRAGYRNIPSGTSLASGSFYSVILWDLTTARTLSVTANLATNNDISWRGHQLVCNVGIDNPNSCWRVLLYNPTSAAIDISGLRLNYTAIINNN